MENNEQIIEEKKVEIEPLFEEEVDFDPEDPDKKAKLFFSLAAIDHDQHIQNIQYLYL